MFYSVPFWFFSQHKFRESQVYTSLDLSNKQAPSLTLFSFTAAVFFLFFHFFLFFLGGGC